jgi:hypothetical protein
MSNIHKLPVQLKHAVSVFLDSDDLDEMVCIVKLKDGSVIVLETEASFEFKCVASKLLDYEIKNEIDEDD